MSIANDLMPESLSLACGVVLSPRDNYPLFVLRWYCWLVIWVGETLCYSAYLCLATTPLCDWVYLLQPTGLRISETIRQHSVCSPVLPVDVFGTNV